jgi:microcystin-dependent protein
MCEETEMVVLALSNKRTTTAESESRTVKAQARIIRMAARAGRALTTTKVGISMDFSDRISPIANANRGGPFAVRHAHTGTRHGGQMKKLVIAAALAVSALVPAVAQAQTDQFLGEMRWVGFNFAPKGWALCDGQILSIAQNTALFSLLGTTYGGDGRVTFALPDMRGRVPMHMGDGPGLTPRVIGETGGAETVTLTAAEMPTHSHQAFGSDTEAGLVSPTGNVWGSKARVTLYSPAGTATAPLATNAISNAGGNQPHENMQPYLTATCIISLVGIFPARS